MQKSKLWLMFDDQNPHSLMSKDCKNCCFWTICALVSIPIIGLLIITIVPLFGLRISHVLFSKSYNMTTGKSLFSNYSSIKCYNSYAIETWFSCFGYGLYCVATLLEIILIYVLLFMLWYGAILPKLETNYVNVMGPIKRKRNIFLIGEIIIALLIYLIVIGLGLLLTHYTDSETHNMFTGLPLLSNGKHGQLICYLDSHGLFLVTCFMQGLFSCAILAILCVIPFIVICCLCLGTIETYNWCKKIPKAYEFVMDLKKS